MNAYTTRGQAKIKPRDIALAVNAGPFLAGDSLAALERTRGWQAEAEVAWLLKQHGVTPQKAPSLTSVLRQTIGAALVRAGQRLAGTTQPGTASATASAASALRPAG